ncbi:uncharacterized protein LOC133907675 isoform X1 [Phragmites australis]|uniref:uncharacterized protein LOC133907675 isoform X1 n=1 Tax=Phragmites australis TaxID=29695 RepID=UPI002D7A2D1A|nr:uncharacterized protein LOC133907675 isoform X1 [Phragmites australis]
MSAASSSATFPPARSSLNSKGYDMAKLFSGNLTHISPVWYDLKSDGNRLILEGEHNFDAAWVSELQSNGSLALQLVKQLGEALHSISSEPSNRHLELIYVIPAPRMQELNNQDFRSEELQLADSLDGFSLMTYDFSGPQSPGPSAPLKWPWATEVHPCFFCMLHNVVFGEVQHDHVDVPSEACGTFPKCNITFGFIFDLHLRRSVFFSWTIAFILKQIYMSPNSTGMKF